MKNTDFAKILKDKLEESKKELTQLIEQYNQYTEQLQQLSKSQQELGNRILAKRGEVTAFEKLQEDSKK